MMAPQARLYPNLNKSTDHSVGNRGNKKARRVLLLRRAREGGYRSFGFDTHVAQFVCVVLGYEQVCTSQQTDEQDADHGKYDEHFGLLFSIYSLTKFKQKGYTPNSTVMDLLYSCERSADATNASHLLFHLVHFIFALCARVW